MGQTRLEKSLIGKKVDGVRITEVLDVQFIGHSLHILVALENGGTPAITQGTEAGRLRGAKER